MFPTNPNTASIPTNTVTGKAVERISSFSFSANWRSISPDIVLSVEELITCDVIVIKRCFFSPDNAVVDF